MNLPYFAIGITGLFAGIFASRIIMERALRLLPDEDKLKLLDGFAKLRMFGSIPMLLALGLMMGALFLPHEKIAPAYLSALVMFLAAMVFEQFYVRRRLRALAIAESYRRSAVRAQWLSQLGFLCFLGGMAATLLR